MLLLATKPVSKFDFESQGAQAKLGYYLPLRPEMWKNGFVNDGP